jgi:hypothetical protein
VYRLVSLRSLVYMRTREQLVSHSKTSTTIILQRTHSLEEK